MKHECACKCGESRFTISGRPLLHFNCHCTICQQVSGKPFVDALLLEVDEAVEVTRGAPEAVRKRPIVGIDRLLCPACHGPVFGRFPHRFGMGWAENLVFVQVPNLPTRFNVPPVDMHIFYDTRQADVADKLPKHSGYLASQLAFMRHVLRERKHPH